MATNLESTDQDTNLAAPNTIVRPGWVRRLRTRIFYRRLLMVACLAAGLALFLAWLSPQARGALAAGILQSRTLVALLVLFVLVALSLLWSAGQQMDAWVFRLFTVRGGRSRWLDGAMWLLTQIGNMGIVLAGGLIGLAWAFLIMLVGSYL